MYNVNRLDSKHLKTYATEENLMKALKKELGDPDDKDLPRICNVQVVRTMDGRYTAILCNITDGDFSRLIGAGFLLVN
jgi:hypothetical protein